MRQLHLIDCCGSGGRRAVASHPPPRDVPDRLSRAGDDDQIEEADVSDQPGLTRRLGTVDAVVIGLGSMIGAGVFSAFAPAAAAAGTGLLVGLGLAAVVAYCNATASAQLAAQYPTSGGTYVYGRERLGDWWGLLAG
jgi:amino acid permease